jgi:hypothetical protein
VSFHPQNIADNDISREDNMRPLHLASAAVLAFAAFMMLQSGIASAAVCADGAYRAGCAGPRGAVVVRKPVALPVCRWVWVDGVKVKRCT